MTHAEALRRRIWEPCRESHHHKVSGRITTSRSHIALRRRRDHFEKEVFEVPFIQRDAELTLLGAINDTELRFIMDIPPVLSQSSLQIFISAASATTDIRILLLTQASRVSWMFPGSQVVREPKMMRISREECVGRWLHTGAMKFSAEDECVH